MKTLGILGLGAFGQLAVKHLAPHFKVAAYDPSPQAAAYAKKNNIAFTSLEELILSDTQITDVGLRSVVGLPNLKSLSVAGTCVTNAGMATLGECITIEQLDLDRKRGAPLDGCYGCILPFGTFPDAAAKE